MLKLEGLKLAPEEKEAALHRRAARLLRIPEEDVLSVQVLRRSIDAREELHLVYTVAADSWLPASGWRTFWPTAPPRGRERCCPAIAPASRGAISMAVCRRFSRGPWRRRCLCWSGSSGAMPSRMPF